ncbi:MAG: alpha/beta hydrolase [Herminiimonas sp.]|uniref:RBBP9/YdeN family alpha/beta hydrolase n=1 Tax=Herminiimonas sp. TaxID=1926289 RepID=UPI002726EE94|nr:alpha/beta hydrolase [Herminiimonas sp.]MDO9422091.1 alpha/beta hydrolase [Herminiimonas sp.]
MSDIAKSLLSGTASNKASTPSHTILILPGLGNSGAGHWQTHWEATLPNVVRVQQQEWDAPQRSVWVAALNAALLNIDGPVILVAHSLGCALVAWWVAEYSYASSYANKIAGALLVAPADVEQADFPEAATDFSPMPRLRLPFKTIIVASSDDPWCSLPKAKSFAVDWHAEFVSIGASGHINAQSNLGDWPQGREYLAALA